VREGRLAQKVQPGESEGYRFPPQLARFRAANDPVAPFATYLWTFETEATAVALSSTPRRCGSRRLKSHLLMRVVRGPIAAWEMV